MGRWMNVTAPSSSAFCRSLVRQTVEEMKTNGILELGVCLSTADEVISVCAWHMHVGEDQVRRGLAGHLQAICHVAGCELGIAERFNRLRINSMLGGELSTTSSVTFLSILKSRASIRLVGDLAEMPPPALQKFPVLWVS